MSGQEKALKTDIQGMFKDTCIMLAITVIAGLLLGLVYQVTKDPIAVQKELAKQEACKEVLMENGSVTRAKLLIGFAPRSAAASSRLRSIFSMTV